ncbi:hypothetical protein QO005_003049 [Rhizobium paknamense]|uniref:Uncharacterized protein n=1 Tax=Rhizobium paknamense TaxID=1206817 RepID=A0ABU0IEN5_9HYPH|nr:hypothetical protein [Rhizobium paknamense]
MQPYSIFCIDSISPDLKEMRAHIEPVQITRRGKMNRFKAWSWKMIPQSSLLKDACWRAQMAAEAEPVSTTEPQFRPLTWISLGCSTDFPNARPTTNLRAENAFYEEHGGKGAGVLLWTLNAISAIGPAFWRLLTSAAATARRLRENPTLKGRRTTCQPRTWRSCHCDQSGVAARLYHASASEQ